MLSEADDAYEVLFERQEGWDHGVDLSKAVVRLVSALLGLKLGKW
jgi:hypothetical protein